MKRMLIFGVKVYNIYMYSKINIFFKNLFVKLILTKDL